MYGSTSTGFRIVDEAVRDGTLRPAYCYPATCTGNAFYSYSVWSAYLFYTYTYIAAMWTKVRNEILPRLRTTLAGHHALRR